MDEDEHNRRLKGLAAFRDRFMSHYKNARTRLPVPSDEQFEIMWLIDKGYHVKIEAVPGSGKTTTAILYAQFCQWEYGPGERCNLHLTYSSPHRAFSTFGPTKT
jgi:HrpA-like RNA helicase